jgi:hypothetical protein
LNDVLFIPRLKKNILSISSFSYHKCAISDCSLASLRTSARGVQDGGLYRLLANPMKLVHSSMKLDELSSFEEGYICRACMARCNGDKLRTYCGFND